MNLRGDLTIIMQRLALHTKHKVVQNMCQLTINPHAKEQFRHVLRNAKTKKINDTINVIYYL